MLILKNSESNFCRNPVYSLGNAPATTLFTFYQG